MVSPDLKDLLPDSFIREYRLVPIRRDGDRLVVQTDQQVSHLMLGRLQRRLKMEIVTEVVPKAQLDQNIELYFNGGAGETETGESPEEKNTGTGKDSGKTETETQVQIHDLLQNETFIAKKSSNVQSDDGEKSFAIRILDGIFNDAIHNRASDIHIEPDETTSRVRFRIDGVLIENSILLKEFHMAIASRLKIMARLDIAKKMIPQDGGLTVTVDGRTYDMRLSTLPTIHGEKIVIRVVGSNQSVLKLDNVGFGSHELAVIKDIIKSPHGIILATGPTGSGKTTTLYSILTLLNTVDVNVITVEDPVENRLRFANQVQVNPRAGLTFASGLRSILRQDPDIVMVGEIRDFETAKIAVETALTGHLVLSTIHANSAGGVVTRLVEMGVEPYLITSALTGVFAQRLLRRLCPVCKKPVEPSPEILESLEIEPAPEDTFFEKTGCDACHQTGYQGRVGVFELLTINDELRKLIIERAPTHFIEEANRRQGFCSLRENAVIKYRQGLTSVEEVLRHTEAPRRS